VRGGGGALLDKDPVHYGDVGKEEDGRGGVELAVRQHPGDRSVRATSPLVSTPRPADPASGPAFKEGSFRGGELSKRGAFEEGSQWITSVSMKRGYESLKIFIRSPEAAANRLSSFEL
jgi:hypothetical protein